MLRDALEGDLWDLFKVDVEGLFDGSLPVRRFKVLVNRLEVDPRSHLRARLVGGTEHWRDWLGWGPDQELAASTVDAVHLNTYVAAKVGGSKKAKPFPAHPRPTAQGASAKADGLGLAPASSIAAFPAAALAQMVAAASDLGSPEDLAPQPS